MYTDQFLKYRISPVRNSNLLIEWNKQLLVFHLEGVKLNVEVDVELFDDFVF